MATYEVTYLVTLADTTPKQDRHTAVFWLERVIRNRDLELPEHVESVQTVPSITLQKPKKVED
jgi:hypothetical protein